jgi:hypothetical protein
MVRLLCLLATEMVALGLKAIMTLNSTAPRHSQTLLTVRAVMVLVVW